MVWMVTTREIAMPDAAGTATLEANLRLGKGLKEQDGSGYCAGWLDSMRGCARSGPMPSTCC